MPAVPLDIRPQLIFSPQKVTHDSLPLMTCDMNLLAILSLACRCSKALPKKTCIELHDQWRHRYRVVDTVTLRALLHKISSGVPEISFHSLDEYNNSKNVRRTASRAHFSIPSTIFSLSLWRAVLPLLCFRTFSSFLLIDLSSSPLISPAFLTAFGRCLCRLILRISGI
jgi:hypothetical protein